MSTRNEQVRYMWPPGLRGVVRSKYKNTCAVLGCGERSQLSFHHIIPRAEGGRDVADNLLLLCEKHHNLAESCSSRSVPQLLYEIERADIDANRGGPRAEVIAAAGNTDWHAWVYGGAPVPHTAKARDGLEPEVTNYLPNPVTKSVQGHSLAPGRDQSGTGESIAGPIKPPTECLHCGAHLSYCGRGRRPKYCGPACRMAALRKGRGK